MQLKAKAVKRFQNRENRKLNKKNAPGGGVITSRGKFDDEDEGDDGLFPTPSEFNSALIQKEGGRDGTYASNFISFSA